MTLGFLAMSAVAMVVGKLSTNPVVSYRVDHDQPWTVAQHVIDPVRGRNLILQPGSDRRFEPEFGDGEAVDLVSVSPFANASGNREMVGRKRSIRGEGCESMAVKIEMARYRFPDGKLLDSRAAEWMPSAQPVWDVRLDRGLRTIYSTGAGFLVRLDWTDERGLKASHKGEQITWNVEAPLGEATSIGEPVWVTDPRYPDRLIVNFWGYVEEAAEYHVGLAWIELNRERTQIVDCGVLVDRNLGARKNLISIRSPSVRMDDHGVTHVLWMERHDGVTPWTLYRSHVVDRESDKAGDRKWGMDRVVEMTSNCMPTPAHLDKNLRYAYFVVPKSLSCYDGGDWRKARVEGVQGDFALTSASGRASSIETANRQ